MAEQTIVAVETGEKLVLFPRKKDVGERVELTQEQSDAIRKHVDAYVANDPRDLPYTELLASNRRVAFRNGNPICKGILEIMTGPSIEEVMAEAEAENARRESIKQMSDKRRKAIEAELAKYGMSIAV